MNKNVIILFVIVSLIVPSLLPVNSQKTMPTDSIEQERVLIRIDTTQGIPSLPSESEIVSGSPGCYLDVLLPVSILDQIKDQITYVILSTDDELFSSVMLESYPTFEEIENHLETIALTYPNITSLFSIGQSYEDRELWCLEISDNPNVDEQEPEVLFMGLHHAREWPTVAITISLIDELVEGYDTNETIQELVNNRRIWIIPCVNPDGYHYDYDEFSGVKWWRKNRHYFPDYRLYGVDLNRNYGGSSNGDPTAMWGSAGISHHPESAVYCGTEPFSELEIQHVKQFFLDHNIDASISWHTYGELVMWPWGYSTEKSAPDQDYMSSIGQDMAQKIAQMDGSGSYTPTQSAGLYPTTGDTTDWFYGYSHYVLGRPHFAYTIEACTEFHPDDSYLTQICEENVDGAFVLLKEAENISNVPSRVLPPKVTEITLSEDDSLEVFWQETNPHAALERVTVQQLNECTILLDQVSEEDTYWNNADFTISEEQAHSGLYSYHSHTENNKVSAITSMYPVYVTPGLKLSFWAYYEIEQEYDYAFVEVSSNQRTFTILDSFSGKSDDWEYHEYDLSEYEGTSVFIRFRYFTDENTKEDGFWVDDIYPVCNFESVTILQEDITSSPFLIDSVPENSTSYFRIKGYNDAYEWGDYSQLYQLSTYKGNTVPSIPVISGKNKGKSQTTYSYTIQSIDNDKDELFYQIQWGDGDQTEWMGPFESGELVTLEHIWSEDGTYTISARAKDDHDAVSEWGELTVQMPHVLHHPFLYRIQMIIDLIKSLSSF